MNEDKVRELFYERIEARNRKDFTRADSLRLEILNLGFKIQDNKERSKLVRLSPKELRELKPV